jgi:hypothetical protein
VRYSQEEQRRINELRDQKSPEAEYWVLETPDDDPLYSFYELNPANPTEVLRHVDLDAVCVAVPVGGAVLIHRVKLPKAFVDALPEEMP